MISVDAVKKGSKDGRADLAALSGIRARSSAECECRMGDRDNPGELGVAAEQKTRRARTIKARKIEQLRTKSVETHPLAHKRIAQPILAKAR